MLADLAFAFEHPQLVGQCLADQPHINGLYGFGWWLHLRSRRRCKACGRPVPVHREKFCSPRCSHRRRDSDPYGQFRAAVVPSKHVAVPETAEQQANAERLIARGVCAYRNRRGFIRDVGVPRKPEDRGRVFAVGVAE